MARWKLSSPAPAGSPHVTHQVCSRQWQGCPGSPHREVASPQQVGSPPVHCSLWRAGRQGGVQDPCPQCFYPHLIPNIGASICQFQRTWKTFSSLWLSSFSLSPNPHSLPLGPRFIKLMKQALFGWVSSRVEKKKPHICADPPILHPCRCTISGGAVLCLLWWLKTS